MSKRYKNCLATLNREPKRSTRVARATARAGLLALGLFVLTAAGCTSAVVAQSTALRSTAIDDMKCTHAALKVEPIDYRTAGVEGCGYRATYAWNDKYETWVRKDISTLEPRRASLSR